MDPVLRRATCRSGVPFSIRARVISAYRHRHAKNITPARYLSMTVSASILPKTRKADSCCGCGMPNRSKVSSILFQNSCFMMGHSARCSIFSVTGHAMHALESAVVSFPTVYNVRCQTLTHCSYIVVCLVLLRKTILSSILWPSVCPEASVLTLLAMSPLPPVFKLSQFANVGVVFDGESVQSDLFSVYLPSVYCGEGV